MSTVTAKHIPTKDEAINKKIQKNSLWWDAYRRVKEDKLAVISFFVIVFYVLMALGSYLGLIFTDFNTVNEGLSYAPPSWDHWFGTDFLGRDVMSRAAHGTITSLTVAFSGSLIGVVIGTTLGALAGYFGGFVDDFIVWVYSTLDNIPGILLLTAFALSMGAGLRTMVLSFGLTIWVGLCRLIRGEFLKHRESEYVQAARSIGAGHFRRIVRHILPNVSHLVLITFSLSFVGLIKAEVILTYLGLGVEAGTPSWGVMIDDAKQELARGVWWNLLAASLFMFVLVLAFNLFNDSLRNALDPKSRK